MELLLVDLQESFVLGKGAILFDAARLPAIPPTEDRHAVWPDHCVSFYPGNRKDFFCGASVLDTYKIIGIAHEHVDIKEES